MIFAYQSIEKQQGLRTCNDNKTPVYLTDPASQNTLTKTFGGLTKKVGSSNKSGSK